MRLVHAVMFTGALVLTYATSTRASQGQAPPRNPSDAEIAEAVGAVERANDYRDVVDAVNRYQAVLSSTRIIDVANQLLQDTTLDANRRGLLLLERQLALDCRQRGPTVASQLLSVRLVMVYALQANSPQQFAGVLDKFAPLAPALNAQLVRDALNTPGNTWPPVMQTLMEQLGRDWQARGSLAAATGLAEAAKAAAPPAPEPARSPSLAGHWRTTIVQFDSSRDEHLVLNADGTAQRWTITASSRTPPVTQGRWSAQGNTLSITWADGTQSAPFTFYEGQLVFPSTQGRRKFYDRMR